MDLKKRFGQVNQKRNITSPITVVFRNTEFGQFQGHKLKNFENNLSNYFKGINFCGNYFL